MPDRFDSEPWELLKAGFKWVDRAGEILAVIISWQKYHELWPAIWHGALGWLYIGYLAITGGLPHA